MQMQDYQVFSKRNKVVQFDVLEYDWIPEKLRNQIYFIWKDALGAEVAGFHVDSYPSQAFMNIHDTVCREHGIEKLNHNESSDARRCFGYLREGLDNEMLLDLIEVSMREIKPLRTMYTHGLKKNEEEAIKELNQRFRENGVGYEFTNGILIRKDSEYIHEEVTKPALHLLQEEGFEGALEEFLEAHDYFRKEEYKPCIISASNAFESTMKTICAKQGWEVSGSGTSSQLIRTIVENGLVPNYLESYMASLRGLSTVRNKKVGHGQGEEAIPVPAHFVNYALHLCATNIVFLVEAYRDLPE